MKRLPTQDEKTSFLDLKFRIGKIVNVEEFLAELTCQEREIIREQLTKGSIEEDDIKVIRNSTHDIEGFLNDCGELSDVQKALVLNAVGDAVSEVKRTVSDILSNGGKDDDAIDVEPVYRMLEYKG